MSTIQERYEKFKRDQNAQTGTSAYVVKDDKPSSSAPSVPSPIGVSPPIKTANNNSVDRSAGILEGGQIVERKQFEQERRVKHKEYADQKRAYLTQTAQLRAEGYVKTGTDSQGRETWQKQQAIADKDDMAEVEKKKKEYSVTEQLKRGFIDYPISGLTGLGHAVEDASAKKTEDSKIFTLGVPDKRAPSQAGKVEETLQIDTKNPAVGPIKSLIQLGSLGLANLMGDKEGQKRAKQELGVTFQGIKERPVEYGAAGFGDVADLAGSGVAFAVRGGARASAKAGLSSLKTKVDNGLKNLGKGNKAYAEESGVLAEQAASKSVDAPKGFVSFNYKVKKVGPDATLPSDALRIDNSSGSFIGLGGKKKVGGFENTTVDLGRGSAGLATKDGQKGVFKGTKPTKDITPEDFGFKESGRADGTVQLTRLEKTEQVAEQGTKGATKTEQASAFKNETINLGQGATSLTIQDASEDIGQQGISLLSQTSTKSAYADDIITDTSGSSGSTLDDSALLFQQKEESAQLFKSKKEQRIRDKGESARSATATDTLFSLDKDARTLSRQRGFNVLESPTTQLKDKVNSGEIFGSLSIPTTTKPVATPTQTTRPLFEIPTKPNRPPSRPPFRDILDTPHTSPPPSRFTFLDTPFGDFGHGGGGGRSTRGPWNLPIPRGGGGGSLFGIGGRPLGGTRVKGLSVINPFSSALNITGDDKNSDAITFKGLGIIGGGSKGKRTGGKGTLKFGDSIFSGVGKKGKKGLLF